VTRIALIVAADERGGIGRDGGLPWRLPDDLRRFKVLTMGKPILMGRRTWNSIGRPLPGRRSIVVSRQPGLVIEGAEVAGSLEEALRLSGEVPEVCVIGGAELYRAALPLADTIYLTRVHATVPADTFLPALNPSDWTVASREEHPEDERHAHSFSFIELQRASPGGRAAPWRHR